MAMDQQRRRLTVSACDPVVAAARSGAGSVNIDERIRGFFDSFKGLGGGKAVSSEGRRIFVRSKTDAEANRVRSYAEKTQKVIVAGTEMTNEEVRDFLRKHGIHYRCKKGQKPESPNQDSFSVLYVENHFAMYNVLDGHGPNGHDVSDTAQEFLVFRFLDDVEAGKTAGEAFKASFLATQAMLEEQKGMDCSTSGATCTMVFHDFCSEEYLTVAHVGDSRSVMLKPDGPVEDLTVDHKPNLPEEKKRIENSKPPGRVIWDGYYNHRVFAQGGMYPGLNMSRALGDVVGHKEAGISAEPDVKVLRRGAAAKVEPVLLVCSDGVWEFIESSQAVDMVKKYDETGDSVEKLTKKSWDAWMTDSGGDVCDDITAVCVYLNQAAPK